VRGAPPAIDDLRISEFGTDSVKLEWDELSDIEKYEIYYTQGDTTRWTYLTFTRLVQWEAQGL
jgi:hypothetical protein